MRNPRTESFNRHGGRRDVATSVLWWTTIFCLAACVLLGGSGRADAMPLLFLRPALVVGLAVLLAVLPPRALAEHKGLWLLFGCWTLVIAVQLVPLPPGWWTALPGRSVAADAAEVAGFAPGWHASSLAPDLTWNSLLALLPAFAMMAAVLALPADRRASLVMLLVGLVFVDVLLAISQTASGPSSPLYYYSIANRGAPTGVFANRNHNAFFLVAMLPLLNAWVQFPARTRESRNIRNVVAGALAAAIVMLVLIAGSRAGLILLGVCLLVIAVMQRRTLRTLPPRFRWTIVAAAVLAAGALLALTLLFGRALSIDRLVTGNVNENRFVNLGTVIQITRDHFPIGSGFGTFDPMFRMYEPDAVLKPTYFNHAHNDLIETAMTGGLPALLVLAVFLGWWIRRSWTVFRAAGSTPGQLAGRASAVAIGIVLIASLSEYPLRAPLFTAIFTIYCAFLEIGARRGPGRVGIALDPLAK